MKKHHSSCYLPNAMASVNSALHICESFGSRVEHEIVFSTHNPFPLNRLSDLPLRVGA